MVTDSGAVIWYRNSGEQSPTFVPEVMSSGSPVTSPVPGLVVDLDRDGEACLACHLMLCIAAAWAMEQLVAVVVVSVVIAPVGVARR